MEGTAFWFDFGSGHLSAPDGGVTARVTLKDLVVIPRRCDSDGPHLQTTLGTPRRGIAAVERSRVEAETQ